MRCLEIKRQMTPTDIAEVSGLLAAAERADGHRPLDDHAWLDLVEGGRPGFAGLVAWEPGHDHPVAYAQVSRGNNSWALELVVDPHHRYEMATIGPELLDAAVSVIADSGGGHVHWWVFEPTAAHDALASEVGLAPGRTLLQMRRALPFDVAAGPVHPPLPAWARTSRRGWRSTTGPSTRTPSRAVGDVDTLRAREKEPWFDPDGFLLHERDGRLAGFCWTKVHDRARPAVWARSTSSPSTPTSTAWASAGSSRSRGWTTSPGEGITVGMLYVDNDNTAAVSLYESLGFTVHRTDRAYTGDIQA